MAEVIVTSDGQITLTKDVREKLRISEGDIVNVNIIGDIALVSKRNPKTFDKHDFLPANFSKTLEEIRGFSVEERLKKAVF